MVISLQTILRKAGWLLLAMLSVVVALVGLKDVINYSAAKIYKNIREPDDAELPVSVRSYPSGLHVVSVIGGRGEGLNCSLPPLFDYLFEDVLDPSSPSSPVKQRFRQACVFHDLCYRHGLATYGYSQSDCDQMLQEQAFRICLYVSKIVDRSNHRRCQLDAKKVLGGVDFFGFDFYQGARTSTYFKFNSNPTWSDRMSVVRVINHPFKKFDPTSTQNEPDHLLLRFEIIRSGVTVTCINCPHRKLSRSELEAAGLPSSETIWFDRRRSVWLPSGTINSAPQVLSIGNDREVVVWLNRQRVENTVTCIIIADPMMLLTHTRPSQAGCFRDSSARLMYGAVDLYSSSPQVTTLSLPGASHKALVAFGLTGQQRRGRIDRLMGPLQVCSSTDLHEVVPPDQLSNCFELRSGNNDRLENELGAFQNFPITKGERQIYLSRTTVSDPHGYDAIVGRALIFDLDHRHLQLGERPQHVMLIHDRRFLISDEYDPMMPITKDKDDLRLLSVRSLSGKILFYEIDLAAQKPEPAPMQTVVGLKADNIEIAASWSRRPIVVVETDSGNDRRGDTQLVLSRSKVHSPIMGSNAAEPVSVSGPARDPTDQVDFQFVVLERERSENRSSLKWVRGLQCKITYTLNGLQPLLPCRRASEDENDDRTTPATLLQGAQLLAGRFRAGSELHLALPDACLADKPIILQTVPVNTADQSSPFVKVESVSGFDGRLKREVNCKPLSAPQQLAKNM